MKWVRYYVDKLPTGFIVWNDTVKGYLPPDKVASPFSWDPSCAPTLEVIKQSLDEESWLRTLASLWAQESNGAANATTDVRSDHLSFIKSLCTLVCCRSVSVTYQAIVKMYEDRHLDNALAILEPLWQDSDRFKQRAAAEILQGILRGIYNCPL